MIDLGVRDRPLSDRCTAPGRSEEATVPTPPLSDPARPLMTDLLDTLEDLDEAGRYLPASGLIDTKRRPEPYLWAAVVRRGRWHLTCWLHFEDAFGWTAPADVDAVGVLSTVAGISRLAPDSPDFRAPESLDDLAAGGSDDGPADARADVAAEGSDDQARTDLLPRDLGNTAVRLVGAVDRYGTVASRLRFPDGVYDRQPCGGRLLDIMLRCLDRPTPPPACDTKRLLAGMWLGEILDTYAQRGCKRLSWRDAVAVHPLVRRARRALLTKLDSVGLAALAAADDPPPPTWRELRLETFCFGLLAELFPRGRGSLAEWLDDGAYARWILGQLDDPLCTWPWVHDALTPQARSRVGTALSQLLGLGGG